MTEALRAGVKRVVFTSSCSTIGLDAPADSPLTEDHGWNESLELPLLKAKLEAERWALTFAKEKGIGFVSLCLPSVVGPGFHRHTPNTKLYEKALLGALPPLPDLGFHIVDARDAALAHALAYENPKASGRYVIAGEYFDSKSLPKALKESEPTLKVTMSTAPKAVIPLVCAADWVTHKVTGKPRELTLAMARSFVGRHQRVSSDRARRELGWEPRPAQETFQDTFDWIREKNLQ